MATVERRDRSRRRRLVTALLGGLCLGPDIARSQLRISPNVAPPIADAGSGVSAVGYFQAAQLGLSLVSSLLGGKGDVTALLSATFELLTVVSQQLAAVQKALIDLIERIDKLPAEFRQIVKDQYRDELLNQLEGAAGRYALYLNAAALDPNVFGNKAVLDQLTLILADTSAKRIQLQKWQGGLHPLSALILPLCAALEFSLRARLGESPATRVEMVVQYLRWVEQLLAPSDDSLFGQIKHQQDIHAHALDELSKTLRWKTKGNKDWTWEDEIAIQQFASLSRVGGERQTPRAIDTCAVAPNWNFGGDAFQRAMAAYTAKRQDFLEVWNSNTRTAIDFPPPPPTHRVLARYAVLSIKTDAKTQAELLHYSVAADEFGRIDPEGNKMVQTGSVPRAGAACWVIYPPTDPMPATLDEMKAWMSKLLRLNERINQEPDRLQLELQLSIMNGARAEISLCAKAVQVTMEARQGLRRQLSILRG